MTKKIKLKISARLVKKRSRRYGFAASRHCRFCGNAEQLGLMDFKNVPFLRGFLTERGKILPARISGNCCLHQRALSQMIKRSRIMALLPYTSAAF
ncbi:MAG: 30S ribosomal protein S18 [Candidatus Dependentiae bacterium]|nr:30S ribosomal protein S18 [Candidatus Dependentiae bacterium]